MTMRAHILFSHKVLQCLQWELYRRRTVENNRNGILKKKLHKQLRTWINGLTGFVKINRTFVHSFTRTGERHAMNVSPRFWLNQWEGIHIRFSIFLLTQENWNKDKQKKGCTFPLCCYNQPCKWTYEYVVHFIWGVGLS